MTHIQPMETTRKREVRWSDLDMQREYYSDAPTPKKLANLLKQIDEGCVDIACELMSEIEGRDGWIHQVAQQRREAVTALEWSIEPRDDTEPAKEAAEYVQGVLDSVLNFAETLEWLQTGTGCGVAATELIWRSQHLVETNDVPGHRLIGRCKTHDLSRPTPVQRPTSTD